MLGHEEKTTLHLFLNIQRNCGLWKGNSSKRTRFMFVERVGKCACDCPKQFGNVLGKHMKIK